jgi:hypothetical protein
MQTKLAIFLLIFAQSAICDSESDARLERWLESEAAEDNSATEAKACQFYLRLVIGGGWSPENAAYEVRYTGSIEDLALFSGKEPVATLQIRTPTTRENLSLRHPELLALVRECVGNELLSLPKKSPYIGDPSMFKLDGNDYWVFVKYGEHQNSFRRTDESWIVNRIYENLRKCRKAAEPVGMRRRSGSRP